MWMIPFTLKMTVLMFVAILVSGSVTSMAFKVIALIFLGFLFLVQGIRLWQFIIDDRKDYR